MQEFLTTPVSNSVVMLIGIAILCLFGGIGLSILIHDKNDLN